MNTKHTYFYNLLIAGFSLAIVTGCKKNDSTPTPSATSTNTTSAICSTYVAVSANPEVINFPQCLDGMMSACFQQNFGIGLQYVNGHFMPYFYNNGNELIASAFFLQGGGALKSVDVGKVSVNDTTLPENTSYYSYQYQSAFDTTIKPWPNQLTWKTAGGNGHSALNYTSQTSFSAQPVLLSIPDSIGIAKGVTISLSNAVSGADSVTFSVTAGDLSNFKNKKVAGSVTSVTFSPADLQGFNKGSFGEIGIVASKYTTQTFSGKTYLFVNQRSVSVVGITIY